MLPALFKACGDLLDRRVLAVLVRSLGLALAIFVALAALLAWALAGADPCGWIGLGSCPLDGGAGALGGVAVSLVALWLLFPAVALGVLAAFAEEIVAAVEARHYRDRSGGARRLGMVGTALLGLRSSGRLLLVNVAALPLYLLLLVTGVGPFLLFVLVNGWAAGRDFGELLAWRRGDGASRRLWLRASRGDRTGIGVVCAGLFLVPGLNLLAPVIGAAAVTHLYHRTRLPER